MYFTYFGGGSQAVDKMRTMRACPFVSSRYSTVQESMHSYTMIDPLAIGLGGLHTYQSVSKQEQWDHTL